MNGALEDLLEAPLWALAQDARWFSGRARGGRPTGVTLGDWLPAVHECPRVRSAVLSVTYSAGDTERYHVPLSFRTPGTSEAPVLATVDLDGVTLDVVELCDDPQAAEFLLAGLVSGAPGFERFADDVPVDLPARRFTGEQSNTTLFYGDALLAKVFRRLEDGPNVDVELHRELAGSGAVADCYGAWRDGDVDLAVFLEAFTEPVDGFDAAVAAGRANEAFAEHAAALGTTLARVHTVLAERLGTSESDLSAMRETFQSRYEAAVSEFGDLERFRDQVLAAFADVDGGAVRTHRIHGDCHLGQVLLTGGEWRYVDFEGEPLKSLEERRQLDTPWRDVAGMLRSFDYAAGTASAPDAWRTESREAFLTAYRDAAGPGDAVGDALLRALEVDKAVYEAIYESRNRPAMLPIPLDFLESL